MSARVAPVHRRWWRNNQDSDESNEYGGVSRGSGAPTAVQSSAGTDGRANRKSSPRNPHRLLGIELLDVPRRWPQNVYVWSSYAIATAVFRVLLLRVPVQNESAYGVVQAASSCTGPWGLLESPTATSAYRTSRSRPRTRRIVFRTRRFKAEPPVPEPS